MQLLRVVGENEYELVETTERLSNIKDAILIAQGVGDGKFVMDTERGEYVPFELNEGHANEVSHADVVRYVGQPGPSRLANENAQHDENKNGVSQFGVVFSEIDGYDKTKNTFSEVKPGGDEA